MEGLPNSPKTTCMGTRTDFFSESLWPDGSYRLTTMRGGADSYYILVEASVELTHAKAAS